MERLDTSVRKTLEELLGVHLLDHQWMQATLPASDKETGKQTKYLFQRVGILLMRGLRLLSTGWT